MPFSNRKCQFSVDTVDVTFLFFVNSAMQNCWRNANFKNKMKICIRKALPKGMEISFAPPVFYDRFAG